MNQSHDAEFVKLRESFIKHYTEFTDKGLLRGLPDNGVMPLSEFCDMETYAILTNEESDGKPIVWLVAGGSVAMERDIIQWIRANPTLVAEIMK